VAYFKVVSRHSPGEVEENHKDSVRIICQSDENLNRDLPNTKASRFAVADLDQYEENKCNEKLINVSSKLYNTIHMWLS
jgi:hypothetical protein